MLCELLLVLAADVPESSWEPVVFISKSMSITLGQTRACEPLTTKNATQKLRRNCDIPLAMLCSPVWHECMRLKPRWWEVRGERQSYNFYDFSCCCLLVAAGLGFEQRSGAREGTAAHCNLQYKSQRYIDRLTRCLCSSSCNTLNYKLNVCVHHGSIARTWGLSGLAGTVSLSGTLR